MRRKRPGKCFPATSTSTSEGAASRPAAGRAARARGHGRRAQARGRWSRRSTSACPQRPAQAASTSTRHTPTRQVSTRPAVPEHRRATPTQRVPLLAGPLRRLAASGHGPALTVHHQHARLVAERLRHAIAHPVARAASADPHPRPSRDRMRWGLPSAPRLPGEHPTRLALGQAPALDERPRRPRLGSAQRRHDPLPQRAPRARPASRSAPPPTPPPPGPHLPSHSRTRPSHPGEHNCSISIISVAPVSLLVG